MTDVPPAIPGPSASTPDLGARPATPWVPIVIGVIGAAVIAAALLLGQGDEGGTGSAAAPGEIFLQAAADAGPSPFTPPVDPPAPAQAAAAVNAAPQSGVTPAAGAPLYGGSGDNRVCDREAMIRYLTENPDKGRAWAATAGIAYGDLPAYVRSLTPTVLLYDTRVTNHGFANGRATSLQSVLQAGTAVLVDRSGQPVTKCKCGNPLRPPIRAVANPRYVGTPWPGFQPGVFVTVVIHVESTTTQSNGTSTTSTTAARSPAQRAVQILRRELRRCGKTVRVTKVAKDPDLANTYLVDGEVDGATAEFVVDVRGATVSEGDQTSAQILEGCGSG